MDMMGVVRQVYNGVKGTNRGSNEGKRRESRILQKLDEGCVVGGGGTYSTVILLAQKSEKERAKSKHLPSTNLAPLPGP